MVRSSLPPVGVAALATAESYWRDGRASFTDLERARLDCWAQVAALSRAPGASRAVNALRALICVLDRMPDPDDLLDLLVLATEFADQVDEQDYRSAVIQTWGADAGSLPDAAQSSVAPDSPSSVAPPGGGSPSSPDAAQSSVAPDSPSSVAPPGGGSPSSSPRVNAGIGQDETSDSEEDPTKKDPP